jgi:hypothetical protein
MAKETGSNEIVALKKIRMDNEREGVSLFSPLLLLAASFSVLTWLCLAAVPDHRHTRDQDPEEASPPERYQAQGDRHLPRWLHPQVE